MVLLLWYRYYLPHFHVPFWLSHTPDPGLFILLIMSKLEQKYNKWPKQSYGLDRKGHGKWKLGN